MEENHRFGRSRNAANGTEKKYLFFHVFSCCKRNLELSVSAETMAIAEKRLLEAFNACPPATKYLSGVFGN